MLEKVRKVSNALVYGFLICIVSLCDINGVKFCISVPILLFASAYKNKYLLYGTIGMIIASFFMNSWLYLYTILFSIVVYLGTVLTLSKWEIDFKLRMALSGGIFNFIICLCFSLSNLQTPLINLLFIPILTFFVCYNVIDSIIDLKSKETKNITKKELAIFSSYIALIVFAFNFKIWDFRLYFFLILTLNYLLVMLDPFVGAIVILVSLLFNFQYASNIEALLIVLPSIFTFKQVNKNRYWGAFVFFAIGVAFTLYFNDYNYINEFIAITIVILLTPTKAFNQLKKYLVDPKEYELKLYQKSYYKCLNRNNKIQKVISSVEDFLKSNPKMKRASREILLQDLDFLTSKLKEDEDIHLKEQLEKEFSYNKIKIISFRLTSEYFDEYLVDLEVDSREDKTREIVTILEEYLNVKLRIDYKKYNHLLNCYKYKITNQNIVNYNLVIKQKSKDLDSCGDSYSIFETKNKKYLLISDGMGHGRKASIESKSALFLLKSFIELGMDVERAIMSCNILMYSQGKEEFNTLDLLEYDYLNDDFVLYKNGSGATYLKNGKQVEKVDSENLPLGIIENIKVSKINIEHDFKQIILTSDGIKKDLSLLLSENKHKSKELLEVILNEEKTDKEDDQTIAIVSVIKN